MAPRLSIVIETLNYDRGNPALLLEVINALRRQCVAAGDIEIIVVIDPEEQPDLGELLQEDVADIVIVEALGAHYYAQKNRGAHAASGAILGFIDSDCVPAGTWAAVVLEVLGASRESRISGVQGPVTVDGGLQAQAFAATSFGQVQQTQREPAHMLTGNNCAFRREEFLAEPFDESPLFHGPEVRKLAKLQQRGEIVSFEPRAAVRHAFYPGLKNFLTFSTYWGWCFLKLRRDARARGEQVPYGWFNTLGWLAPLILSPAKLAMDLRRLLQNYKALGLTPIRFAGCLLWLAAMAPAVGYGGMLERLGREPPVPPY